ncbi:probable glycosyltransferase At5g11130 [Mercurialis annua]|uniref:probable glycosyltransferase At5g11130 n=1 Tax=Mercurialis annua TaxID=3986 RepID=UPI0021607CDC|nr:probable glycosyltransferase At5g11130 [Mercurialis annua]
MSIYLLLAFCLFSPVLSSSIYLSPSLFFPNYQKMLQSFKIYTYTPPKSSLFSSPLESIFFTTLQNSQFITLNPEEAHLFFIPFSSNLSTRSLARVIRDLRLDFPYWNRTLGADHFYLSCTGLGYESDRNLVELKKNSVQISCFPSPNGKFIPHKDITLPPLVNGKNSNSNEWMNKTAAYKGFVKYNGVKESTLIDEMKSDPDFLIEAEPSDKMNGRDGMGDSEFCVFEYGEDNSWIGEALRFGCIPVVITDRPIQDLPLMDVLRWQEIMVIVGPINSIGGLKGLKNLLDRTCRGGTCEGMRRLGVEASKHFVWNEEPQPFDAFHMVMYQLWIRRHVIRYARREFI